MNNQLTVLIPCKNERLNIRPCIESVRGIADELLIADSGSTDGTLNIVRDLGGCRIIEREYVHSGDFKNWAIPQASYPWVLIVDGDERVPEALAAEIRAVLQSSTPADGYWIYQAWAYRLPRSVLAARLAGSWPAGWYGESAREIHHVPKVSGH